MLLMILALLATLALASCTTMRQYAEAAQAWATENSESINLVAGAGLTGCNEYQVLVGVGLDEGGLDGEVIHVVVCEQAEIWLRCYIESAVPHCEPVRVVGFAP